MLEILLPSIAPKGSASDRGFVDVLGGDDAIGPHRSQRVFASRLVPRIYERLWRPTFARLLFGGGLSEERERQMTMEMLSISAGDRVIDVGCGTGNYTRHLARAAGDGLVVGLDASASMLAAAVRRDVQPNLAYVRGGAEALPFADESFDAACCVGVIHLLENPMRSLSELVRVLAPGGRLAIMAVRNEKAAPNSHRGLTVFGRGELTGALADHGLIGIDRHELRRAHFVVGQKPRM